MVKYNGFFDGICDATQWDSNEIYFDIMSWKIIKWGWIVGQLTELLDILFINWIENAFSSFLENEMCTRRKLGFVYKL